MTGSLTTTQLAETVGMTVRNIRAYQSRGLLHPPEIRGRTAYYNGSHVARLQLVTSLQREGFTLAAIKRLLERPASYAAIVADRRRRFRDDTSDIDTTVPLPTERIRELLPDLPEDLTETGLVWKEGDQLVTHTMLMGIGRTLAGHGIPLELLAKLQLDAASTAQALAETFCHELADDQRSDRLVDLAKVAVQLSAAAYEIAFLDAVAQRVRG